MTMTKEGNSETGEHGMDLRLPREKQIGSSSQSWDLLVLTDHADWNASRMNIHRTLFVCFDAENAECLRQRVPNVQNALDYAVTKFSSYQDLFEFYTFENAAGDSISLGEAEIKSGHPTVSEHLLCKAVEVCAPVIWMWETTERILCVERAESVIVDMHNPWLKTVVEDLVVELGMVLGG